MYTQCPECGVAFRVTAEVLRQAAGRVRCGGCASAFNALEHLSESKPAAPARSASAPDPALPELSPGEPVTLEADAPPTRISAEQNEALLKTLDQLAGEDIRIEDTGSEWRVVDDDEPEEGPEPTQVIDEMRFDDNTPLPEDFDYVSKPAPAPVVEPVPPPAPEPEAAQVDLAFGDPDEWDELLGDIEAPVAAQGDVAGAEAEVEAELQVEPGADRPLDTDTQFELQAEAMGLDLSGLHEKRAKAPQTTEADHEERETSIEEDLMAAAFEAEAAVRNMEDSGSRAALEEESEPEIEIDLQLEGEQEAEDDVEDIAMGFDDKVERVIETIAASLDDEAEDDFDLESAVEKTAIPEMTEEEKTFNLMIDQELLSMAVEDDEGFASTIVQRQPGGDGRQEKSIGKTKKDRGKKSKNREAGEAEPDGTKPPEAPTMFETIVMEGESVREVRDTPRGHGLDDPGVSIPLSSLKDDYARRGEIDHSRAGPGVIAGVALLLLVLLAQVAHNSRAALATVPAFNAAVGPVYRMLGMPLTPAWNIQGWRFEATKGDVDDSGQLLTIYSRVGNKSDESLPYPLVHLSLTDRFEESIGSTVLEPVDYLPENSDPRRLVPPGNTFNAIITIESPSPEATSFKLNVCYRLASGLLRCQDESFK